MLDAARKIVEKTSGIERTNFDENEDLRLAVAHLIQTLGEAAPRVPVESQRAHPEIPWRQAIGIRHKIVHHYVEVDDDIVWQVATENVPPLIPLLAQLVEDDAPEGGMRPRES